MCYLWGRVLCQPVTSMSLIETGTPVAWTFEPVLAHRRMIFQVQELRSTRSQSDSLPSFTTRLHCWSWGSFLTKGNFRESALMSSDAHLGACFQTTASTEASIRVSTYPSRGCPRMRSLSHDFTEVLDSSSQSDEFSVSVICCSSHVEDPRNHHIEPL